MDKADEVTKILLDADVIRHFISGEKLNILAKIFPGRFCIIDRVKKELCKSKKLKIRVEEFIKKHKITEIKFPEQDQDILFEYFNLRSEKYNHKGDGESACFAYARYNKTYISSSNLSDVAKYCEDNGIHNIPTMDLLEEALKKRLMTEKAIDVFLSKCISKGRILPAKTWKEYMMLKRK